MDSLQKKERKKKLKVKQVSSCETNRESTKLRYRYHTSRTFSSILPLVVSGGCG